MNKYTIALLVSIISSITGTLLKIEHYKTSGDVLLGISILLFLLWLFFVSTWLFRNENQVSK